VAQKFEALKKAKQQSGGKQFMGDAEIVPSDGELPSGWDVLADEDCFDGHPTWEWAFKQHGYIDKNVKIDMIEKELCLDLT